MDLNEFKRSAQDPRPAYLLLTDQDYLRRKVLEYCREQIQPDARAFDWTVFDLKVASEAEVVSIARTLPWMSPQRWIYVQNAEDAKKELLSYLKKPATRSVMLLEANKKPRGWPAVAVIEMPEKVNLAGWIKRRCRQENYEISNKAVSSLVDLVGEDLQRLVSELEKQFLWNLESRQIDVDSVLEMTFQTRDYDVFALIGSIAAGEAERALSVLHRLIEVGMSAPALLAMLYWNFRRLLVAREMLERRQPFQAILSDLKVWSYRGREKVIRSYPKEKLTQVLIELRNVDRLCKSTSLDERIALERLIIDTCRDASL